MKKFRAFSKPPDHSEWITTKWLKQESERIASYEQHILTWKTALDITSLCINVKKCSEGNGFYGSRVAGSFNICYWVKRFM